MSLHEPQLPQEHPAEEVLGDFVLGDLHLCRRVLLEAHLAFCARCRQRTRELTLPAAAMLEAEPSAPATGALWARLAKDLDAHRAPVDILAETPLPAGARGELPLRTTPLDWDSWGDGAVSLIAGDSEREMALLLVRAPPEIVFPYHVHLGSEELVMLAGGFTDQVGHMAVGDFRAYGTGTAHAPVTDAGGICWAVTLVTGGVQFDS